jgi:hypothetical protein
MSAFAILKCLLATNIIFLKEFTVWTSFIFTNIDRYLHFLHWLPLRLFTVFNVPLISYFNLIYAFLCFLTFTKFVNSFLFDQSVRNAISHYLLLWCFASCF